MDAVQAMRRYVFGFVNSHDLDVCRRLMSEDYVLHRGQDQVVGQPVPPVAVDPWSAARIAPSRSTENAVTSWLDDLAEWPPASSGTALEIDPGPADGRSVEGHLAAFVEVREGALVSVRGATNRVALARQLRRPARG